MQSVSGRVQPRRPDGVAGMIETKMKNVYKIPVNERGSLQFMAHGAKIISAELFAGGCRIAVCAAPPTPDGSPTYLQFPPPVSCGEPHEIGIPFIGDARFHRALLDADIPVEVVIITDDDALPSLRIGIIGTPVTWETNPGETYVEAVDVSTTKGVRNLKLVYKRNGCGYQA